MPPPGEIAWYAVMSIGAVIIAYFVARAASVAWFKSRDEYDKQVRHNQQLARRKE